MTEPEPQVPLARPDHVDALAALLPGPDDGPRCALLAGPEGSGRRALVAALAPRLGDRLLLRFAFQPSDDGVGVMLRLVAGAVAGLARGGEAGDAAVRDLRENPPAERSERFGQWLEGFLAQIDRAEQDEGGNLQISLPRDNPLWGMLQLLLELAAARPVVLELHQADAITSVAYWTWLAVLLREIRARELPVLTVLSSADSPFGEEHGERVPTPSGLLLGLLEGHVDATLELAPLDAALIQAHLDDRYRPHGLPEGLAARLATLSRGSVPRLGDLLGLLEREELVVWDADGGFSLARPAEELEEDLLIPDIAVELEGDDAPTPDEASALAERILQVAALEGDLFTAAAVARVLDLPRDTVDDVLDELDELVAEQTFVDPLQSWIYRFQRPLYRQHFLESLPERTRRDLAGRLARTLVDGFVPAAYRYIPVAARLFREAGQGRQARNLLALAMGTDRLDLSRFAIEVVAVEGGEGLPEGLLRLLHAEPAERAVNGAPPEIATEMVDHLGRHAEAAGDGELAAFEQLLRSKLALRQRDLDGAVRHAEQALQGFAEQRNAVREGETHNHLALLALHRQDFAGAKRHADQATRASNIPPVKAHAQFIRGLLRRQQRKLPAAAEAFGEAGRTALQAGNLVLTLEARLNQGEMLIAAGRAQGAVEPLRKAIDLARSLRATPMHRAASSLLAQALAATGEPREAFERAQDALDLGREARLDAVLAADLYHAGLFGLAAGQREAAARYLEQALEASDANDAVLRKEIFFHRGQLLLAEGKTDRAREALQTARELARKVGDGTRELRTLQALGMTAEKQGERDVARTLYRQAADGMTAPQLARERELILQHLKEMDEGSG